MAIRKPMGTITDRIIVTFLRGFFRLLYRQFAWTYDGVAWAVSMGAWNSWVRCALPYLPGPNVLELGSGPGRLQAGLGEGGICSFGLDASPQMVRQATRRLRRMTLPARLALGQAQALPFATGIFNQVAATFPTEYIYASNTLAEVRRVLKPGGSLIVIPAGWIKGDAFGRRLLRGVYRVTRQSPPQPGHEVLEHLQAPFRSAGFDVSAKILNLESADLLIIIATNQ